MFTYKTEEELKAMTSAEREQYLVDKRKHESDVQKQAIEVAVKAATEPINVELKSAKDEAEKANKRAEELGERLTTVETKGGDATGTFEEQLKTFLTENQEAIKALKTAGTGVITFTSKAVGTVTTANGTNTSPPAITGTQQAPLQPVRLRDIPVFNLVNNFQTDLAAYPYTEAVPGEGDADIVAEGGTKPQIDFDWDTKYVSPYKVAAWIKLTEEAVQDVRGLQDVAENYLKKRHDLKKAKLILYGTGSGGQPTGATATGRLFTAGDLANKVRFTNFMDVVNASIVDIATTHNFADEVPYMANLVMVNPVDFFSYIVAAKDERGLPLYPMASIYNQVTIGSVTIIPEETIPAGKIFVADMEKYNVDNYMPYTVKIGWVNDDFIKNQFVILGESRFHAFVRNHDKQAFIYDDIETIKTAITYVAP